MNDKLTIACIIPARLASIRFPEKILSILGGKPLLEWDWQAAHATKAFDHIAFAIDSAKTANLIEQFGGTYFYTPTSCRSGTDRIIKLMNSKIIEASIWVNWQADEPFICSNMIQTLLQSCSTDRADIWTLKKKIDNFEEISSPNVVKVVTDQHENALYFSRSPIPFYREKQYKFDNMNYFKHIGIYAYTNKTLEIIEKLPSSLLEKAENLEQLRFLHHGLRIKVHETDKDTISIDHEVDLYKAEKYLASLNAN